jgi:hypoxanthine phosphoribosyltransferase
LQGRTALILDDVLDEGITLAALKAWCREQGAAAVFTAVLIDKQLGRERPCRADFVGLEAENRYLFGYGMDYKGYLRNAAGIYACKGL